MLRIYNKVMDAICTVIKYVVAGIIVLAITISFMEVIRRYLFGRVFVWSDEFIRFAMIYIGLVGGAAAYRYGQLVCFDSLLNKLSGEKRFALGIITDVISLVFLILCFVLSIKTVTSKSVITALSTGMKIPMVVPYMAFVIGFFLMILFCIGSIFNRIQGRKGTDMVEGEG